MEKVRYAIIGFGGIAENRIAKEGFCIGGKKSDGNSCALLSGATDTNSERKNTAESMGIEWYDTVHAVLADKNIDAVFIATSNGSHAGIAEKALEAGKHCIIEKPLATALTDAVRVKTLAEKYNRSVIVDHMMKNNVYNIKARDAVAGGAIGEVNDISLHMEFLYGATKEEAETWRCANPEELGGPIGDVGSHCLYMAEFLLGSIVGRLNCVYLPKTVDIQVENGAVIQFRTVTDIGGTIRVAFNRPRGGIRSTLANFGYEIFGSKGTIRSYGTMFQLSGSAGEPVPLKLEIDTAEKYENFNPECVKNIYQVLIEKHALSIINKKPLVPDEGVRNLAEVLGCHESAKSGGKSVVFRR